MEIVSYCSGRAWRVRLWTHDAASSEWVERLRDRDLGVPRGKLRGATRWEAERSVATEADPLVEVHLRGGTNGSGTAAWATLGKERTSVHAPPADARTQEAMIRPATPEEVLRLALCWFIGWRHLGCYHPDEQAFGHRRLDATAWVIDDVDPWLERGSALPDVSGPRDESLAVFLAFEGRDLRLEAYQRVVSALSRSCIGELTGGVFLAGGSGERCILACASLQPVKRARRG
jgi:hypothetical protein